MTNDMQHLDEARLIDAVDGRLDPASAAHLAACADCASTLEAVREVWRTVDRVEPAEPSPLFWDHFPSRVRRAVETLPRTRPWYAVPRIALGGALAALALIVLFLPIWTAEAPEAPPLSEPATATAETPDPLAVDLETDEAWALVRSAAEDLDYEEARDAGLAPRAGAIERAAMELTADERAELARLIAQELKRTGA